MVYHIKQYQAKDEEPGRYKEKKGNVGAEKRERIQEETISRF